MDDEVRSAWVRIDVAANTDEGGERMARDYLRRGMPGIADQVQVVVGKRGTLNVVRLWQAARRDWREMVIRNP